MKVTFYKKPDGTKPVLDFLKDLDDNMRGKFTYVMTLLQEKGTSLRMPYSRPVDSGIFELRMKFGSDITRVLYFFVDGNEAILTNGFVKKSEKTPQSEITLAKKYRDDYLSRKKEEE